MKIRLPGATVALAVALSLSGPTAAAQQINTTTGGTDAWEGGALGMWNPGTPVSVGFGQLFYAAPGAPVLDSFSFWLADYADPAYSPDLLPYRAFLGEWNGSSVTSVLWQSGDRPNTTTPGVYFGGESLSSYTEVSFNPGQALSPGSLYLAYLFPRLGTSTPSSGFDADLIAMRTRQNSTGVADGQGGAVRVAGPVTAGTQPAPTDWAPYNHLDAAFTATMSQAPTVVPEPESWLLVGTGLLGLGIAARRRLALVESAGD